jgi:hypothetical protein
VGRLSALVLVSALAFLAVGIVDCAQSACSPALLYKVPAGPDLSVTLSDGAVMTGVPQQGVNVSGHELEDCWITFSQGSIAAEYHLAPLPPYGQHGVPLPYPADPSACLGELSPDGPENCDVIQGPAPSACFRTSGCLVAYFGPYDRVASQALSAYLGSTTYDVTVLCGNDFVVQQTGLSANSGICAL